MLSDRSKSLMLIFAILANLKEINPIAKFNKAPSKFNELPKLNST